MMEEDSGKIFSSDGETDAHSMDEDADAGM